MEETIIVNTLVNTLSTRLKLDSSASNVLNILVLKLFSVVRTYDSTKLSQLRVPRPLLLLMDRVINNFKYFMVLYAIKFIYSKKEVIRSFNQPKLIESETVSEELFEIDISNITKLIDIVHRFIGIHPEYFKTNIAYRLVHIADNPEPYRVYNDKLHFNDLIHGVEGYISTKFTTARDHKNEIIYNYEMKLCIKKNIPSDQCYINQLERYVDKQTRMGKIVDLRYYKIMPKNLITTSFYTEDVDKWRQDCKYMEETFFSEHKEFLFSVMKSKVKYDISTAGGWNNMILHGPPGCGKSSVVCRIATLMKKAIISVDLSLYLDKKKELYALFHGQEFALPEGDKLYSVPNNCIIILEEFDHTINKLMDLEKIYQLKQDLIETDFKNKQNAMLESASEPEVAISQSDKRDYQTELIARESMDGRRPGKPSISKITHEIDQALHTNNLNVKSDILRLKDLLELFQGPIVIKDRLIIATTNYYDDIKNSLPALFRPGRMSPLHFTYLTWGLLEELSQYYFGKPMTIEPRTITIPTSQIVEMALKYQLSDNHDGFQEELTQFC